MPSNATLFLSVLAGYSFIHLFYFTRFRAQRLDGYRLVIESAIVGVILYTAARIIEPCTPATLALLQRTFSEKSDLVDTAYVLGLGLLLPITANLIIALAIRGRTEPPPLGETIREAWSDLVQPARRAALNWAVRKLGNDLLLLLHEAVTRPRERQMPILLTLDNNKVYVGWVTRSPNLKPEDEYLSILPLASGYRHKDTLDVNLNVYYPVHDYADRGGQLDPNDFTFVIPYASVRKANYFDVDVYVTYFAGAKSPTQGAGDESEGRTG